jgi:predicted metalloprotease
VPFTDADIELGMIALVEVRDPVGTNVLEPGGHGSAFDRIGAFQEGFYYGVGACADLIDHPLPLQDNEFDPALGDAATNGNAPFGFEDQQIFRILNDDLTTWWPAQLAPAGITVPEIKLTPVTDTAVTNCGDQTGLTDSGAIFCAATNEILFDQAYARELYDDFGDFAVGYIIGRAWAEAVQTAMASPLQGEARALASDCLSGAWIGTAQTTSGPSDPNHRLYISPGDLDEAVQTALVVGDDGIHDDVTGSAFERVAHLRLGVLNGLPACYAEIQG